NLVRSRHCDVERAADQLQIPRRIQSGRPRHPSFAKATRLRSSAGNRLYRFRFEIDFANQMILGVRNVQGVAVQNHPLRAKESSVIETTVVLPMRARSDCVD